MILRLIKLLKTKKFWLTGSKWALILLFFFSLDFYIDSISISNIANIANYDSNNDSTSKSDAIIKSNSKLTSISLASTIPVTDFNSSFGSAFNPTFNPFYDSFHDYNNKPYNNFSSDADTNTFESSPNTNQKSDFKDHSIEMECLLKSYPDFLSSIEGNFII